MNSDNFIQELGRQEGTLGSLKAIIAYLQHAQETIPVDEIARLWEDHGYMLNMLEECWRELDKQNTNLHRFWTMMRRQEAKR